MMHLKCYDDVKRIFALFLLCSSFANRASVSVDLYIDFDRNLLTFLVACLVCQVDSMIIFSLLEYPYALHIIPCIPCHVLHHVACALHRDWLLFCCLCSCLGQSREKSSWTRNLLSTFMRSKLSTTLRTLQARWSLPPISLISLLASCSFYRYVALPTTCYSIPPILPCQASNPPS